MSGASIADSGVCSFRDYTAETSPEELRSHLGHEPTCVADFIEAWVRSGKGIRACIGDLQTFLITAIAIIDEARTDAELLDYVTGEEERAAGKPQFIQRRPKAILGGRDIDHNILDPHFFATWRFRVLHSVQSKQ